MDGGPRPPGPRGDRPGRPLPRPRAGRVPETHFFPRLPVFALAGLVVGLAVACWCSDRSFSRTLSGAGGPRGNPPPSAPGHHPVRRRRPPGVTSPVPRSRHEVSGTGLPAGRDPREGGMSARRRRSSRGAGTARPRPQPGSSGRGRRATRSGLRSGASRDDTRSFVIVFETTKPPGRSRRRTSR